VEGVAIAGYRRVLSERMAFGILPAALSALLPADFLGTYGTMPNWTTAIAAIRESCSQEV